jgi:two-component system, LytTR family, response regulator
MTPAQFTPPLTPAVLPTFPASYQRNSQRISLPYINRTVLVSVDDIMCLEGEGNYTFLYTRDRKKYLVARTLKNFEGTLSAEQFVRIHKSYMVNLAYVQTATINLERSLRLADGREITVSRRRQKAIMQQLNTYLQRLVN